MHKKFNLYKCDCKIIVAEGQKIYTRTYFIIASNEEVAEMKAFRHMTKEYEAELIGKDELVGKSFDFQPSISCFVYNCIV